MRNIRLVKTIKSRIFNIFLIFIFISSIFGYQQVFNDFNSISTYFNEHLYAYIISFVITVISIASFYWFLDSDFKFGFLKYFILFFSSILFSIIFVGYQQYLYLNENSHFVGSITATLLLSYLLFEAHFSDLKTQ